MSTESVLTKIRTHWENQLRMRGENPLRHALRYYDWYKLYMSPDPEIDHYFEQLETSPEYVELMERLNWLDEISRWVAHERTMSHDKLRQLIP
jgi:hypothetical protein